MGSSEPGSAFTAGLNPIDYPASAVKLLFLQVVLSLSSAVPLAGQGLLVPSLEPASGDLSIAVTLTPSQTKPEGTQSCITRVVNRGSA